MSKVGATENLFEAFGPNIWHISVFDNIVADMLIILTYAPNNQYGPITRGFQWHINNLFETSAEQIIEYGLPLDLLILQIEQQKHLRKNSKLSA